uniref:Uncharacterized protein n=1 Tax=Oryza punctata TaxID=4537 RepID=A0A0E0KGG7_ORYPU
MTVPRCLTKDADGMGDGAEMQALREEAHLVAWVRGNDAVCGPDFGGVEQNDGWMEGWRLSECGSRIERLSRVSPYIP